jgi:hypothetical protein
MALECLHCHLGVAIEEWNAEHGVAQPDGRRMIDPIYALAILAKVVASAIEASAADDLARSAMQAFVVNQIASRMDMRSEKIGGAIH